MYSLDLDVEPSLSYILVDITFLVSKSKSLGQIFLLRYIEVLHFKCITRIFLNKGSHTFVFHNSMYLILCKVELDIGSYTLKYIRLFLAK